MAVLLPVALAGLSPLLAYRSVLYILAGFAGSLAMGLLVLQPLAVGGYLPALTPRRARRLHGWVGMAVVLTVVAHVVGLWITSPPDVVDALLFASPTRFSLWGVLAMWAVFFSAGLAILRQRGRLALRPWRALHGLAAVVIVGGTVLHALLIDGTMEPVSKYALALGLVLISAKVLVDHLRR